MPVHNALPYLDEAIESILAQTFEKFEFVILDDASTDGSTERLRWWASTDRRIRLLEVRENLGPALSSDMVARAASADIVARMDADDISYPHRLEQQIELLRQHPDVGIVGGVCDIIDGNGRLVRRAEPWRLLRHSVIPPFSNGTLMYRRNVFEAAGGYRKECDFWEDCDLILRMAAISKALVIPHAVYQARQSAVSTRFTADQARLEEAYDRFYRVQDRLLAGQRYEDLLNWKLAKEEKVDPRVFTATGPILLWAGRRPRLFRRLLQRSALAFNVRSTRALIWTGWASLSPSTLRFFHRLVNKVRNYFGSRLVRTDAPVSWSPPSY